MLILFCWPHIPDCSAVVLCPFLLVSLYWFYMFIYIVSIIISNICILFCLFVVVFFLLFFYKWADLLIIVVILLKFIWSLRTIICLRQGGMTLWYSYLQVLITATLPIIFKFLYFLFNLLDLYLCVKNLLLFFCSICYYLLYLPIGCLLKVLAWCAYLTLLT